MNSTTADRAPITVSMRRRCLALRPAAMRVIRRCCAVDGPVRRPARGGGAALGGPARLAVPARSLAASGTPGGGLAPGGAPGFAPGA